MADEIVDSTATDADQTESDDVAVDDTVTDDDKAAEQLADKATDAESDGADGDGDAESISYDDLAVPDGMDVDAEMLGEFKELASQMNDGKGLSAKDAQLLVDLRAKGVKASVDGWESQFSEWRGELLSDPKLGGDNFKEVTVPNVIAATKEYGTPEMLDLLESNKMYGENPHLIRMLNRVGETLRADQHVRGKAARPNSDEARLRRMYPSHYNDDGSVKESHKGAPA